MTLASTQPRRPEHAAVRHILSSPSIAARCAPHVGEDDVDWPAVLAAAETMSGGEQVLVGVALDLWESEGVVGVWELPERLDRGNFQRVLEALGLCRGELAPGLLRDAA